MSVLTTTGGGLACKREHQFIKNLSSPLVIRFSVKLSTHAEICKVTYLSCVLVQHVEYICYRLLLQSDSIHHMTYCTALILDNTDVLHWKPHCKVTGCFIQLCYSTKSQCPEQIGCKTLYSATLYSLFYRGSTALWPGSVQHSSA